MSEAERRGEELFTPADLAAVEQPDGSASQGAQESTIVQRVVAAGCAAGLVVAGGVAGVLLANYKHGRDDNRSGTEPRPAAEAPAWATTGQEKIAEAAPYRRAIAKRHAGGCAITGVVDTRTSEIRTEKVSDDQGFPAPMERVARNKVIITVEAATTPASAEAEAKYANGTPDADLVRWRPFPLSAATTILKPSKHHSAGFARVPIPSQGKLNKGGPHKEIFTITMYPRTDNKRTTSANIVLRTTVTTGDPLATPEYSATYVSEGVASCGDIVETKGPDSRRTWGIDPNAPIQVPDFSYSEHVCLQVRATESGNSETKCL
jgi:hypothetical protein